MLHWFKNRNAAIPAKEAAEIFSHVFTPYDAIKCLGSHPQAVDSAIIRESMQTVRFHLELLERCAETHALVYMYADPTDFVRFVGESNSRLLLPKKGRRDGFDLQPFYLAKEGWHLVRLAPHPDTFDHYSAEQEEYIGHVHSGESVASAYVAAYAALGLAAKYDIDIVGGKGTAYTSDHAGSSVIALVSQGNGRYAVEARCDRAELGVGAISMIEP